MASIRDLAERVRKAARVYVIGNGGSHANAMHIANDLISCGIRAHTLDAATLTMLANDYGWDEALPLWIKTIGEKGDLLIALSGSGTSPNILAAVARAREIGLDVHEEFGAAQGFDMQMAEEYQLRLGHALRNALKPCAHDWSTLHDGRKCMQCGLLEYGYGLGTE